MELINQRQHHVLAQLNQERDETAKELKAKDQLLLQGKDKMAKELQERDQQILKLQEQNLLKSGDGHSIVMPLFD